MDQRFTADERLSRQTEIDACYRQGSRLSGRFLRLHFRPNGRPVARLAVSIPGRVCGAVDRNRWKRLLREAFRRNKDAIGPGVDIIVVPHRPPGELKRQDVENALLELFARMRTRSPGPEDARNRPRHAEADDSDPRRRP